MVNGNKDAQSASAAEKEILIPLALIVSPLAKGLFHGAILESVGMWTLPQSDTEKIFNNTIDVALVMKGKAKDAKSAANVRQKMQFKEIAAFMRGLTAEELFQAFSGGPGKNTAPMSHLIIDGHVIPDSYHCILESGNYNKVPVITGTNQREHGSIWPLLPSLRDDMPNYVDAGKIITGELKLKDVLPTQKDRDLYEIATYYGTHLYYTSPFVSQLAQSMTKHQKDVYAYLFKFGQENVRGEVGAIYGAGHATELPFFHANYNNQEFLNHWDAFKGYGPDSLSGRKAVSETIVKYEANFFRTGNPNGPGLPVWKSWSSIAGGPKRLLIDGDKNKAYITMSHINVPTVAEVRKALDEENPAVQEYVKFLVFITTPPIAYETNDYFFPRCK